MAINFLDGITVNGNVGIGTTSPSHLLEVQSDTAIASINGATTNGKPMLFVGESNAYGVGFRWDSSLSLDIVDFDNTTPTTTSGTKIGHFKIRDEQFYWKGSIGLGTTSPATKLDILDTVNQTAIRVTNNNYNNYLIQKRRTDNSQILGIQEFGSNGSMSLVTGGSQRLNVNNLGNVGIGTTSPSTKLDVNGDTIVRGNVGINGATSIDSPLDIAAASTGNNALFQKWYYSPNAETYNLQLKQTVTSGVVRYNFSMVNNSTAYNDVLVLDRGKVGIGTTSPAQKLTVNGTIMSTGSSNPTLILQDSTHSDITIKGDSGIFSVTNQSVGQNITMLYNGNVGIGTTNPVSKLQVNGTFTSAGVSNVGTGANTSVYLTASSGTGKVGVGTTSPAEKLDVNGNVKASGYKTSSGTGVTTNVTVRNQNNSNTVTFQIVGGIIVGIT